MITRWLVGFALVSSNLASAQGGDVCKAPASGASAPVVAVPDYQTEATAQDPEDATFERDYKAYQENIVRSLNASPDPHDWALAATGFHLGPDANEAENLRRLQRAVDAAPDDVLGLWMALNGSRSASGDKVHANALEKLKTADADNAAVWLESLSIAAKNHDHDAASKALQRMSATSQFNNHFAEMAEAIVAAHRRFPMPDSLYAQMPEEMRTVPKDAMPLIYATSITAAFALPAFQTLTNACRNDGNGRNADRAGDCQTIGRMMVASSDTLIGTAIGSAVLRMSRTYDDSDIAAARDVSWVRTQFTTLMHEETYSESSLARQLAFHQDWLDTNSETQAMRNALERAGIAVHPADDWVDTGSRFTTKVMAAEESYFADHKIDY